MQNILAIFKEYWDKNKDVDVKRQFISSCVEVKPIERSRKRDGNKPKTKTLIYTFKVCKVMFVINVLKKRQAGGIIKGDLRGKPLVVKAINVETVQEKSFWNPDFPFKLCIN